MEAQQTSYSITYTNSTTVSSAEWTTIFNNVLTADGNDYLANILKSYNISQSGYTGNITITFTFAYWETAAQTAAVDAKVAQVLSDLGTVSMNDYQKEKAIHDWIVSNVIYDTTLTNHSAYAAITSPYKTVCQGYALLAYKMFTAAGLDARIITGTGDGVAHAWNLVQIDGNWYQIDLTWDDPVGSSTASVHYDYYNLTDTEMDVDHSWTGTYPSAFTEFSDVLTAKETSDSANASFYESLYNTLGFQYLTSEYTCSSATDIQLMIQKAITAQETKATFRYTNKNTLSTDLKTAATASGYITAYNFSAVDFARTTSTSDIIVNLNFTSTIPIHVTSVSLSKNTLSLVLGGTTATLTATISPANASTKTVVWTTSDAAVATVTNGVVKAVGGGTATITATTVDGSYTATCTVTVTAPVTAVALDKTSLAMTVGDSDTTLKATLSPTSATNKDVTWTSSNTSVATVDSTGKIHAVATGKAIITVKTVDGAKTAICTVTVYNPVTGVTLNTSAVTLKLGQSATALTATVAPATANKAVTWTSSNPAIAKVSTTGAVTPVAVGTVTITSTTTDSSITAVCTVTVIQAVTSVTLDKTALTITTGGSDTKLTATIAPATATTKTVTWTSSNTAVATVDPEGNVHAVGAGTAVITVTSTQDTTKYAKCTVTVTAP